MPMPVPFLGTEAERVCWVVFGCCGQGIELRENVHLVILQSLGRTQLGSLGPL